MKVELSLQELTELLKLASLGKLMSGMIHNLNSPLQNIGMDIELAGMFLNKKDLSIKEITEKLRSRIARMEGEFDRINRILKRGMSNVQMDEYYRQSMTLNLFLQQVLKMLEANLYFKHNVSKEMDLMPELPKLGDRSENFWLAIIWFMQSMTDNLEKNEIKWLGIGTGKNDTNQEMVFRTREGKLSDGFLKTLNDEAPLSDPLKITKDAMLGLALHILRSEGVITRGESTGTSTIITFHIPLFSNNFQFDADQE